MFFDKKNKCKLCDSKIKEEFSYCPYCGHHLLSKGEEMREFGMLGKNDSTREPIEDQLAPLGITDKLISSLINGLIKNIDKQVREVSGDDKTEVTQFPNGVRIKINANPMRKVKKTEQKQPQRKISEDQLKKLSELPREIAKSKIRRLSDKVIYELAAPGVESPDNIFFSKLESGYEIKAIGKKKIYVNSVPIELPLRGFAIDKDKILVEFKLQE
jgi:hypothetical protein